MFEFEALRQAIARQTVLCVGDLGGLHHAELEVVRLHTW